MSDQTRLQKRKALATGARCHYCGESLTSATFSVDHWLAKAKGGGASRGNTVFSCRICNSIKGDRAVEEVRFRLVLKKIGWPKFELRELEWLRSRGFDMREFDEAQLHHEMLQRGSA